MTNDPISGLSDQRYFHVALVSPRTRDFDIKWVWNNLRKDSTICPGRYKRVAFEGGAFEFKTAEESSLFAGSIATREALATSKRLTHCAYDIFGGSAGKLVLLGTGYGALTRTLVSRLISRGLLSRAWFLTPRLHDIVEACRGPEDSSVSIKFTITGFSAFVPGVKNLKSLRLGGTDVFGSGLVKEIEHWLQTRGREELAGEKAKVEHKEWRPLLYQAVRLKAVGALSGSAVSVSLAGDGGCKMWLRKNAVNLPEFAATVSTLHDLGRFETTADAPSWSDDGEM
jgi:hypothetical protein